MSQYLTSLVESSGFEIDKIRADFPILAEEVHGKPLVYLDNAATSQKPQVVIDAINCFYRQYNANIHRGLHELSQLATDAFEDARIKVQRFIHADDWREIVFVRGCTEAINLVAQSWGCSNCREGDEILITQMEHHSNIVPWQIICQKTGAVLKVAPINQDGELQVEELEKLLSNKTKLVAIVHISNALGTINPVKQVVQRAHAVGAKVLVDGAQAAPHLPLDVQDLDVDFYALSGHKLFGPMGIGVLYGKKELLESMPPYQGGGSMIKSVTFEKTTYADLPQKFEAGTPNIVGPIGLAAAIDYVQAIGLDRIAAYERDLLAYGTQALEDVPDLRLIGTAREKVGILSFVIEGAHPHDVGTILDQEGVAVRTGHHCTQPLMSYFDVPATVRASLAFYNTRQEIDHLVQAIREVMKVFNSCPT